MRLSQLNPSAVLEQSTPIGLIRRSLVCPAVVLVASVATVVSLAVDGPPWRALKIAAADEHHDQDRRDGDDGAQPGRRPHRGLWSDRELLTGETGAALFAVAVGGRVGGTARRAGGRLLRRGDHGWLPCRVLGRCLPEDELLVGARGRAPTGPPTLRTSGKSARSRTRRRSWCMCDGP